MSPGIRLVLWIGVAVLAVWLLFTVVFPWIDRYLLLDPTMSAFASGAI